MDLRKFFLVINVVLSIFLFSLGGFFLIELNSSSGDSGTNKGILDVIIDPLKLGSESVNILVMGIDKVATNTDTMMVVNYNPYTANISLLSIPRDTKVSINNSTHKINSAYTIGGAKQAKDTVGKLLDTNIKHHIIINTAVFREIVDLLGGVDYDIPVNMDYDDPTQNLHIHLKKGHQHLNGELAEYLMRFRQPNHYNDQNMQYYDGSDLKRIDAQQNFIKELMRQKLNIKYISKVNQIINTVFDHIDTDILLNEALRMSQNINKIDIDEVNMFKLPGHAEDGGAWYYLCDRAKTREIVKQYFTSMSGLSGSKSKVKAGNDEDDDIETLAQIDINDKAGKSEGKDYSQDNPSNAETGFVEIGIEVP